MPFKLLLIFLYLLDILYKAKLNTYIFFLFACPIQSSVSRVVGKGLICSCSSLVRVSCIQLYTMSSIITVTLEMLVWGRLCLDMLTLLTQTSQTLSSSDRLDCSLQNIRTRDTIQGYSKQGCSEQLRLLSAVEQWPGVDDS